MSLEAGTRLGPYEIQSLIGAGGMGEVYLARDTTLHRDVALKILPDSVAADPDRVARFEREARTLASLNHPNIAQIYGFEGGDGGRALVMELVDGATLADRVSLGPIPLKEALSIAKQISDALETAHDRGIIHRDLKPANVKITPDGVVKVLDFGLAKALEGGGAEGATVKATMTSPAMTRAGIILGTAAYMSPEQARGRIVDTRTDVWAFGCVLFEMLTGRGPFDGDTVTDVLGAIVHKDPEWTQLPGNTPERLRRLLERCLAKDQKQRLHNIADARLELEDLIAGSSRSGVAAGAVVPRPDAPRMASRERAAWVLAAAALAALVVGSWAVVSGRWPARAAVGEPSLRVSILHTDGGEVRSPAISPDGRRLAYAARRADGIPMIWVRDLDRSEPRALNGTEDGWTPFWSPDSKHVAFFTGVGSVLKRVPAEGGPVEEIARPAGPGGGSWGRDGTILFGRADAEIVKVSATGGPIQSVTKLPGNDWSHYWPSFLPDGRHFLFTAKQWGGLAEASRQGIFVASLDDPAAARRLLPDASSAIYVPPGYLVFGRGVRLMAAPFDAEAGRLMGEPIDVGEAVVRDPTYYLTAFSGAADGTLAVRPPPAPAQTPGSSFEGELRLMTRNGTIASTLGSPQWFDSYIAAAPDSRSVAAAVQDVATSAVDIWRFEVDGRPAAPLTSMRSVGGYAGDPVWSPDGTQLAYGCQPPGTLDDVCIRDMRTGGVRTIIKSRDRWEHPTAWSPDGQYLLVNASEPNVPIALSVWSFKSETLTPYVKAAATVREGVFSPDAKFVAYSSAETGRFEVYVTTFPERRQTWPLTTDGARVLNWRADGKEIMVATLTGHIAAYPVDTSGGGFTAGPPEVLLRNVGFDAIFARPTRDHSRIVIRVPKDADKDKGEIRLLFGWQRNLPR